MSDTDHAVRKLREALARQKQALLRGDIVALDDIAHALEDSMNAVAAAPPPAAALSALRIEADRNARFLEAATAGVAGARQVLERRADASLKTYDRAGQSAVSGSSNVRVLSRR